MKINSWYHQSIKAINKALENYPWDCSKLPQSEKDQANKLIRQAYPFGQRTNHPYQQWLKAVREMRILRGL